VINLLGREESRSISVLCRMDFVARIRQRLLDEALNLEFILYQQKSHHSILLRLDHPCSHFQSSGQIPSSDEVSQRRMPL
jgi:hypothetical protein